MTSEDKCVAFLYLMEDISDLTRTVCACVQSVHYVHDIQEETPQSSFVYS